MALFFQSFIINEFEVNKTGFLAEGSKCIITVNERIKNGNYMSNSTF